MFTPPQDPARTSGPGLPMLALLGVLVLAGGILGGRWVAGLRAPAEDGGLQVHPSLTFTGQVTSDSGEFSEPLKLEVRHPNGQPGYHDLFFDSGEQGRVARFHLVKGQPGSYRLRPLMQTEFPLRFTPAERSLERSTEGIEFRIHDTVARYDLAVTVLNPHRRGIAGAQFWWICLDADRTQLFFSPQLGRNQLGLQGAFEDARIRWYVTADGHRPVGGTEADFERRSSTARSLEVLMTPGWGAVLNYRDAHGRLGSAGLRVLADGVEVATTDEHGFALLAAESAPARVEVFDGETSVRRYEPGQLKMGLLN